MIFAVYKLVTSFFDSQPGSSDPNWRQTLAGVTAKKNVKAMLAVDLAQNDSRVMACIFKYFDPNTTTVGEMLVKLHSLASDRRSELFEKGKHSSAAIAEVSTNAAMTAHKNRKPGQSADMKMFSAVHIAVLQHLNENEEESPLSEIEKEEKARSAALYFSLKVGGIVLGTRYRNGASHSEDNKRIVLDRGLEIMKGLKGKPSDGDVFDGTFELAKSIYPDDLEKALDLATYGAMQSGGDMTGLRYLLGSKFRDTTKDKFIEEGMKIMKQLNGIPARGKVFEALFAMAIRHTNNDIDAALNLATYASLQVGIQSGGLKSALAFSIGSSSNTEADKKRVVEIGEAVLRQSGSKPKRAVIEATLPFALTVHKDDIEKAFPLAVYGALLAGANVNGEEGAKRSAIGEEQSDEHKKAAVDVGLAVMIRLNGAKANGEVIKATFKVAMECLPEDIEAADGLAYMASLRAGTLYQTRLSTQNHNLGVSIRGGTKKSIKKR